MADLNVLRAAGINVDELPAEQQEAFAKLDQSELEALAAIRKKLEANLPEVAGYTLPRASGDGTGVW